MRAAGTVHAAGPGGQATGLWRRERAQVGQHLIIARLEAGRIGFAAGGFGERKALASRYVKTPGDSRPPLASDALANASGWCRRAAPGKRRNFDRGAGDSRAAGPCASCFSAWSRRDSSEATCSCIARLASRCWLIVARSCSLSFWQLNSCSFGAEGSRRAGDPRAGERPPHDLSTHDSTPFESAMNATRGTPSLTLRVSV